MRSLQGFDLDSVDSSEIEMEIPIERQWPASLKHLEITGGKLFHTREVQLYAAMARMFKLVNEGNDPELPHLETLTINDVYSVLSKKKDRCLSSEEMVSMMKEADIVGGVHICIRLPGGDPEDTKIDENPNGIRAPGARDIIDLPFIEAMSREYDEDEADAEVEDAAEDGEEAVIMPNLVPSRVGGRASRA